MAENVPPAAMCREDTAGRERFKTPSIMKNLIPINRKTGWVLVLSLAILCFAAPAAALDGLQVGMKAPLVKLKDLQGKEVALADQRDANAVVIVFWANWSDNSAPMLERLEQLYRKHKREKF